MSFIVIMLNVVLSIISLLLLLYVKDLLENFHKTLIDFPIEVRQIIDSKIKEEKMIEEEKRIKEIKDSKNSKKQENKLKIEENSIILDMINELEVEGIQCLELNIPSQTRREDSISALNKYVSGIITREEYKDIENGKTIYYCFSLDNKEIIFKNYSKLMNDIEYFSAQQYRTPQHKKFRMDKFLANNFLINKEFLIKRFEKVNQNEENLLLMKNLCKQEIRSEVGELLVKNMSI